MKIVTVSQMKELEKCSDENGVSYLMLMKNAGAVLGKWIEKFMCDNMCSRAVLLSGSGNNGGDCFIAAQYLKSIGKDVSVALVCGVPRTETAVSAFSLMDGVTVLTHYEDIKKAVMEAGVIVDGVFGTGFHGELDSSIASLFSMNSDAFRIAVDVPSGGNAANGKVSEGCFRADVTITFGFKKFGMTQQPLKEYCGKTIVSDIGIPERCTDVYPVIIEPGFSYIPALLKKRTIDSHKGTYGTLVSVTGSRYMPGAAFLSGKSALRSGLGLLKQCMIPENILPAAAAFPEPVYIPMKTDENGCYTEDNYSEIIKQTEKSSALLIGCGLGTSECAANLVKKLIENANCPVILDADGINCIKDYTEIIDKAQAGIILTPHPAEMARLMGMSTSEIQDDRYGACMKFLELHPNAVVVLKGAGTITAGRGSLYVNNTGNPGMSTGGSGDVLAGIIASFAAQGISLQASAVLGVWIHGRAGDLAAEKYSMHSLLPEDITDSLYKVFSEAENMW